MNGQAGKPLPSRLLFGLNRSIEVDSERRVPEGPIETEGTAIARIHLTVRKAAHDREHGIGRGLLDLVRAFIEQVAGARGQRVLLRERVAEIQVGRELCAELLAGVVALGAPGAVVALDHVDAQSPTVQPACRFAR